MLVLFRFGVKNKRFRRQLPNPPLDNLGVTNPHVYEAIPKTKFGDIELTETAQYSTVKVRIMTLCVCKSVCYRFITSNSILS